MTTYRQNKTDICKDMGRISSLFTTVIVTVLL